LDLNTNRSDILPAEQVNALTGRSDLRGLRRLAGHLATLAGTGGLVWLAGDTYWRWPAMTAHGIVLVALFAGLHETVHRTAFRSRWLNDAVAMATGAVLFLPAGFYRRFHFAHHRFTQDPARDPELAVAKPVRLGRYLLYLSAFFYWRDRCRELIRHAFGGVNAGFIPERERALVAKEARLHVTLYAAAAAVVVSGISAAPLWYWLLPAVLGQPFLRAYLLSEHTGCPECADMLANTRTTFTMAPVRWLMWNMPFHTEHHVFPAVPFHALPRLHRLMAGRLVATSPGYVAFHRRYAGALAAARGDAFVHPETPG
jgi:fatty acid desaturase